MRARSTQRGLSSTYAVQPRSGIYQVFPPRGGARLEGARLEHLRSELAYGNTSPEPGTTPGPDCATLNEGASSLAMVQSVIGDTGYDSNRFRQAPRDRKVSANFPVRGFGSTETRNALSA